ncbi:MAG: NAD(P)-dependent glycerol-3-phosphate dehydrogenase [Lachnospiraceae bacterium]|nr:NAD(P)-dependent glycerol-3-phosphate dehydrogenase [Lachnospiraceae bacterium]
MARIGMIGAGSWGTALSKLLDNNGHEVTVWSAISDEIDMLNRFREHKDKLPGVPLGDRMIFTGDLRCAVEDKDALVLAVPSPFTRSTSRLLKEAVPKDSLIISVAKGIEEDTLLTLTGVIEEEIKDCRTVVLCGPSHAEEVGRGMPTAIVAGSRRMEDSKKVQDIFMSEVFRVYTSDDPYGMELGGALKNVIALAAGIADGLGYGDNTKAALITRGIHEISVLGEAAGGKRETFQGLTGIGDLIVTCASMHSRNRRAGILIGQGKSYDEAMKEVNQVVEGVYSAKAAVALAKKYKVQLPIIEQVNAILFDGKSPSDALSELMGRAKKEEFV